MIDIIQLIRIKDWLKNLIIFLPIFFAQMFFNLDNLIDLFYLFIIFSLASSIVYIMNDIYDIKNDQLSKLKLIVKPLARGAISISFAYLLALFLSILLIFILLFYKIVIWHVLTFLFLNLLYNLFLKKLPLIDLLTISLGYIIRLDSGSTLIEISSSFLMIMTIFFLSFFVISMKRFIEINNGITKTSLIFYNKKYLYFSSILGIFFSMIFYILFLYFKNSNFFLTLPVAIYFLYIYFYKNINGIIISPVDIVFKDLRLILSIIVFFVIIFFQMY